MGSRSSTASTNTTKDTTVNNVDNRVAEGDIGGNINFNLNDITLGKDGGGSKGKVSPDTNTAFGGNSGIDIDITQSDFGAIGKAFSSIDRANETFTSSIASTVGALKDTAAQSVKVAESAARDESARSTQLLLIAGAVTVIAVTFIVYRSKK